MLGPLHTATNHHYPRILLLGGRIAGPERVATFLAPGARVAYASESGYNVGTHPQNSP